jgi:hypothetical protein
MKTFKKVAEKAKLMPDWLTRGITYLNAIMINRGIFQGDSLLPLPLCVMLIALTHELDRSKCGYQMYETERNTSHLLYMDDLKLRARS